MALCVIWSRLETGRPVAESGTIEFYAVILKGFVASLDC